MSENYEFEELYCNKIITRQQYEQLISSSNLNQCQNHPDEKITSISFEDNPKSKLRVVCTECIFEYNIPSNKCVPLLKVLNQDTNKIYPPLNPKLLEQSQQSLKVHTENSQLEKIESDYENIQSQITDLLEKMKQKDVKYYESIKAKGEELLAMDTKIRDMSELKNTVIDNRNDPKKIQEEIYRIIQTTYNNKEQINQDIDKLTQQFNQIYATFTCDNFNGLSAQIQHLIQQLSHDKRIKPSAKFEKPGQSSSNKQSQNAQKVIELLSCKYNFLNESTLKALTNIVSAMNDFDDVNLSLSDENQQKQAFFNENFDTLSRNSNSISHYLRNVELFQQFQANQESFQTYLQNKKALEDQLSVNKLLSSFVQSADLPNLEYDQRRKMLIKNVQLQSDKGSQSYSQEWLDNSKTYRFTVMIQNPQANDNDILVFGIVQDENKVKNIMKPKANFFYKVFSQNQVIIDKYGSCKNVTQGSDINSLTKKQSNFVFHLDVNVNNNFLEFVSQDEQHKCTFAQDQKLDNEKQYCLVVYTSMLKNSIFINAQVLN